MRVAHETSNKKPTLLIVAYDFPPIASAGMYRIASIARHLSRRNWRTTVVTVRSSFVDRSNDTFQFVPDDIKVVRTSNFEPFRIQKRVLGLPKPVSTDNSNGIPLSALRMTTRASRFRIFLRPLAVLGSALSFPDKKVGWFFPLLLQLIKLLRAERFDIVLSSSPPHSTHLPILLLRKLHRFTWVSDFRDPWAVPWRGGSARVVQTWMERAVLSNSDAIIANTEGNKAALEASFGDAVCGKITVITNGFDDTRPVGDTSAPPGVRDADLVYTGSLYHGMLTPYLGAMEHLLRKGAHDLPKLSVYGPVPWNMDGRVVKREIAERVVFKGRVSYLESLRVMQEAKALLLLLPHGAQFTTWVPSKLYCYLFSPAPILALAPDGDATRLIRDSGRGVVISSMDPDVIAKGIITFVDKVRRDDLQLQPNYSKIREYSWASLSNTLEGVLRSRIGNP